MKKKLGIVGAGIAAALSAFTPSNTQVVAATPTNSTAPNTKEAIVVNNHQEPIVYQRSGMFGGWAKSIGESRFLNQRQYRKKVRQNPCLYKSKKHRGKN